MGECEACRSSISGVCCSVESCKYHAMGNACTASHIDVKDESASEKQETFCGTYRPLDNWNCV